MTTRNTKPTAAQPDKVGEWWWRGLVSIGEGRGGVFCSFVDLK